MIRVKKYIGVDFNEKQNLERALRKFALKRSQALDFVSSTSDIGQDKMFIGFEGKKNVTFIRLRTSFEKFLPRLIISIPRDATYES